MKKRNHTINVKESKSYHEKNVCNVYKEGFSSTDDNKKYNKVR